jgi:hypothetical protein
MRDWPFRTSCPERTTVGITTSAWPWPRSWAKCIDLPVDGTGPEQLVTGAGICLSPMKRRMKYGEAIWKSVPCGKSTASDSFCLGEEDNTRWATRVGKQRGRSSRMVAYRPRKECSSLFEISGPLPGGARAAVLMDDQRRMLIVLFYFILLFFCWRANWQSSLYLLIVTSNLRREEAAGPGRGRTAKGPGLENR